MAKTKLPNITHFPQIAEIQVLWIVFSSEMEGYCLYRTDPKSIEWIKGTKILRFLGVCVEGESDDLELVIAFKSDGIMLRYDLENNEEAISVPMKWFEGPSGLMLDHRTRAEFLSVLIKPS